MNKVFFRISLLVQRNARKENTLTPFSRKGGKPPKRGPAQPRSSPSWVRAPTAKPSECLQDGDAGLASPSGEVAFAKQMTERVLGHGHPVKGMFFGITWPLAHRPRSYSKQNSTLFRFRPASPIRHTKQFCPAAQNLDRLSQHVLSKGVKRIPKGKGFMRRDKSLSFVRRITPVSPLAWFLWYFLYTSKESTEKTP